MNMHDLFLNDFGPMACRVPTLRLLRLPELRVVHACCLLDHWHPLHPACGKSRALQAAATLDLSRHGIWCDADIERVV